MSIKVRILLSLLFLLFAVSFSGCMSTGPVPSSSPAIAPEAESAVSEAQIEPVEEVEKQRVVLTPKFAELYIDPVPVDAQIRILNIKPKFTQGMRLAGGRYYVEVSAPGYQQYLRWITLEAGKMLRLKVELTQ